MLDSKRILENIIAIFFAFIPMMFLMGLAWVFFIVDEPEDYKREVKIQNTKIQMLIDYQKVQEIIMQDKENKIEILRTQMSQLKPIKRK